MNKAATLFSDTPQSDMSTPVLGDDLNATPAATHFHQKHGGRDSDDSEQDSTEIEMGAWRVDVWLCHQDPVPNCLMSTILPCISLAQIVTRVGWYPFTNTALALMGMWLGALICHMLAGVIPLIGFIFDFASAAIIVFYMLFVYSLRKRMRERFQLPGSMVEDGILSACCSCFAIAQMATHVRSYHSGACDFNPPDTLPGYA